MDYQSARHQRVFPAGDRETRPRESWRRRINRVFPPSVLFYCGGYDPAWDTRIIRSALAQGLSTQFRVVVVGDFGGAPEIELPPSIRVVQLPPFGSAGAQAERRRILMNTYAAVTPQVILVEQFPFGDLHLAPEVTQMLEAATSKPILPLVVSSVRELPERRSTAPSDGDVTRSMADRYFDIVLVHADPNIAQLEEAFLLDEAWSVPVRYTGFIGVDSRGPADVRRGPLSEGGEIVVFGEGGRPCDRLCQLAIDARQHLSAADRLPMRIIAGPTMDAEEFRGLMQAAAGTDGLVVERSVADVRQVLTGAAVAVCHCAYRPLLDVVRSGVAALVVPTVGAEADRARARRLSTLGAVRFVDPTWLDGPALACEIASTIGFAPLPLELDLSGASATVRFLTRMTGAANLLGAFTNIESI